MSSQELQAVLVNDEMMLARPFTLEDGSIQWRNRFGMVIEGAKPVQQCVLMPYHSKPKPMSKGGKKKGGKKK